MGAALGLGQMCKYECSVEGLRRQELGEVSEERPSDSDLCKGRIT